MRINVLLVDDHFIFRRGLRSVLAEESDIAVIGEAGTIDDAMRAVDRVKPDIVLIDAHLGQSNGIHFIDRMVHHHQPTPIIFLSATGSRQELLNALQIGAHAYLPKQSSPAYIADAIRRVSRGQRLVADEHVPYVLDEYHRLMHAQRYRDSGLSDQEIVVLRLLANGLSARDIAQQLFLSEVTVKRRIGEIIGKLNAANRVHAVAVALRRGLL